MFHCNGWCTPWAVTAVGGTHVCLREVRGDAIWDAIDEHGVTHLYGAPTVSRTHREPPQAVRWSGRCTITTAGAPPARRSSRSRGDGHPGRPRVRAHRDLRAVHGLRVPGRVGRPRRGGPRPQAGPPGRRDGAAEKAARRRRRDERRARRRRDDGRGRDARQQRDAGLLRRPRGHAEGVRRVAGSTPATSAWCIPTATSSSRDRAKDVVVSGGENISTIEVEQAIDEPPGGAARWRWSACPTRSGASAPRPSSCSPTRQEATEPELIDHVRSKIARYKAPRDVEFVRAAQDLHRQGPEVRAARAGVVGAAEPRPGVTEGRRLDPPAIPRLCTHIRTGHAREMNTRADPRRSKSSGVNLTPRSCPAGRVCVCRAWKPREVTRARLSEAPPEADLLLPRPAPPTS